MTSENLQQNAVGDHSSTLPNEMPLGKCDLALVSSSQANQYDWSQSTGITTQKHHIAAGKQINGSGGDVVYGLRLIKPRNSFLVPKEARWADATRAAPSIIFRTDLFSAKNKSEKRELLHNRIVTSLGLPKHKVTTSGVELRQDDLQVWLQILHLARSHPLESTILITPTSFLKEIGWNLGGKSYVRLRESISRMVNSSVTILNVETKHEVTLPLISSFEWVSNLTQKPLSSYKLMIPRQLEALFQEQFTWFNWDVNLQLPVGVATWLHGYYSSHKAPVPIKVESIKGASGMSTKDEKSARQTITKALVELQRIGFLHSFKIAKGLVHVQRASQYREYISSR